MSELFWTYAFLLIRITLICPTLKYVYMHAANIFPDVDFIIKMLPMILVLIYFYSLFPNYTYLDHRFELICNEV